MVIIRTRNKITDFLMILAWASPFKLFVTTFKSVVVKAPNKKCNALPTTGITALLDLSLDFSTFKSDRPRITGFSDSSTRSNCLPIACIRGVDTYLLSV